MSICVYVLMCIGMHARTNISVSSLSFHVIFIIVIPYKPIEHVSCR